MSDGRERSEVGAGENLDWREVLAGVVGIVVLFGFIVVLDGGVGIALGVAVVIAAGILLVCLLASIVLLNLSRGFAWGMRWTLGIVGEFVLFPIYVLF